MTRVIDTPILAGGWRPVAAGAVNLSNVSSDDARRIAEVEAATARRRQVEAEVLETHRRMRAEEAAAELRDVELHRLVKMMHALKR